MTYYLWHPERVPLCFLCFSHYCCKLDYKAQASLSWQHACSHLTEAEPPICICFFQKDTPKPLSNGFEVFSLNQICTACVWQWQQQTRGLVPALWVWARDSGGWYYRGVREVKHCRWEERECSQCVLRDQPSSSIVCGCCRLCALTVVRGCYWAET